MPEQTDGTASTANSPTRRRVLRGLGSGAAAAAAGTALVGPAAAHNIEVHFRGCREILVVVNDPSEFGVLEETIHVFDAESGEVKAVPVELTRENTGKIPDRFGDRPVFRAVVSGGDAILALETGDGRVFENPNDCPRPEEPAAEEPAEEVRFAVEQNGQCAPLAPLRFDQPVDAFYDYRPSAGAENARQSSFPVPLTEPGVSRLFLYEGPDGLSLVVVHGSGNEDDPGGAASFEITGLPAGGEWVVLDDSYDGATDVFDVGGDPAVLHWGWGAGGRNDGAAFRGLGDDFAVTIDPAFNETARLEPFDGNNVERWQVLAGDVRSPMVADLALDRPVTIRTGSC